MLQKIGRNDIKMEDGNDRHYQQHQIPIFTPIKIELDTTQYPPIKWLNQRHIQHNQQHQELQEEALQKPNPLKLIQHLIIKTLSAITPHDIFSAFTRKFKKMNNKSTMILAALVQVRFLEQHQKESFHSHFIENIGKTIESDRANLSQQQINCIKESIAFVQQFIEGVPSKATCSFFPKYRKNKIFNSDKVDHFIHSIQQKLTTEIESQDSQDQINEKSKLSNSEYEVEQSYSKKEVFQRRVMKGNPFLIYKREDLSKTKLYPTDASFTPKGIKHLLP